LSALRSHMSSMAERKQKDFNHQSLICDFCRQQQHNY
jgi:hypothetical protein